MKTNKVIITKGIPASGKSTWAKEYCKKNPKFKRVNRDDLRKMIDDGEWSPKNEKLIIQSRNLLVQWYLSKGFSVIIDDTNLKPEVEKEIRAVVGSEVEIEFQDFTDVSLEECIKRDQKRANYVGEVVIRKFHKQITKEESAKEKEYVKPKEGLPVCILVDIDGTLAMRGDRGIFDFDKAIDDKVYLQVKFLLDLIAEQNKWENPVVPNIEIIVFSGREDKFKSVTTKWLSRHSIPYDHVYMRKEGDKRTDFVVKKEMYEALIQDKYNVFFVIDDRKQVVDMWNEIGLYVLVADGGHDY